MPGTHHTANTTVTWSLKRLVADWETDRCKLQSSVVLVVRWVQRLLNVATKDPASSLQCVKFGIEMTPWGQAPTKPSCVLKAHLYIGTSHLTWGAPALYSMITWHTPCHCRVQTLSDETFPEGFAPEARYPHCGNVRTLPLCGYRAS